MTDSAIAFMGAAKASAEAKANEVVEAVESFLSGTDITHVWGYDPDAGNTEHHSGLAADFMLYTRAKSGGIDTEAGHWIAQYCIDNATRLGVRWVIFHQRIWNPLKGGWRTMADRGNPTKNHMDHVHVLFADSPYVRPGVKVVGTRPASAIPAVFEKPKPQPRRKPKLKVDGVLGPNTIRAWQDIMGTYEDGIISDPSSLIMAMQRYVNGKGIRCSHGRKLVVDGRGVQPNLTKSYGPTHTIEALQRYYGTARDGIISFPSSDLVEAIQFSINKQNGY